MPERITIKVLSNPLFRSLPSPIHQFKEVTCSHCEKRASHYLPNYETKTVTFFCPACTDEARRR